MTFNLSDPKKKSSLNAEISRQLQKLSPGYCFVSFKAGEVVKVKAKRKEFRERPGIAVTHIPYEEFFGI
jgi:hypothetical protein